MELYKIKDKRYNKNIMAGEKLSNPQNNAPGASDWDGIGDEAKSGNLARAHTESEKRAQLESEKRSQQEQEQRSQQEQEQKSQQEQEQKSQQEQEQRSQQEQKQEQSANQETFTKEQYNQKINEIDEIVKAKIGDIDIPYKEFECDINKDRFNRITESTKQLKKAQLELAELYARNRRLIRTKKDSDDFDSAKEQYSEKLAELEKLKAENSYELVKDQANKDLRAKHDELGAEIIDEIKKFILANPDKGDDSEEIAAEKKRLIEEATKELTAEYEHMNGELKTKINSEVLNDFLNQRRELEEETIDRLDNGTLCRKIVNKVINNKTLRKVLAICAVVGLAAAGVGLAVGAATGATVGFAGFSGVGAAYGVAKGGFSGVLMSRQNSKNSAVHGFVNEAEIEQQVKGLDFTDLDPDTKHVANWLLDQYESAKDTDFKNNWKRTGIAGGLGAVAGALVNGIEVNANTDPNAADDLSNLKAERDNAVDKLSDLTADRDELQWQINLAESPTPSGNDAQVTATNLDKINIPEGHGAYDTFIQLGGDPARYDEFQEIMYSLDAKYGLVPGSNGETAGIDGTVGQYAHTYPGPIDTWPEAARNYITEVANEAAKQGLIDSTPIDSTPSSVDINGLNNKLEDINAQIDAIDAQIDDANKVITTNNIANDIATAINTLNQIWPFIDGAAADVATNAVTDRVAANTSTNTPTQPTNQSPAQNPNQAPVQQSPVQPTNQPPAPQPQPQPQSVSQPQSAPQPQPPTPNQTPNQNPNQAPDQDAKQYREAVAKKLGNLIGDEGVGILSDTSAYGQIDDVKIRNWWKSLTPDAKKAVVDFESDVKAPDGDNGVKYGRALRTFFQINWVDLQDGSIPVTNPFL